MQSPATSPPKGYSFVILGYGGDRFETCISHAGYAAQCTADIGPGTGLDYLAYQHWYQGKDHCHLSAWVVFLVDFGDSALAY